MLQGLLQFVSHATEKTPEKKTIEKSAQTDAVPQFETKSSPTYEKISAIPTSAPIVTNEKPLQKPNETQWTSVLINTEKLIDAQPLSTEPSVPKTVPPPPPPLPADLHTTSSGAPPPPPPPFPNDMRTGSSAIPPPPGFPGAPPLPPGLPGAQFGNKLSVVGLSALLDSIPKPKGKVRRLQWKKLPQTILSMLIYSLFFIDFVFQLLVSFGWMSIKKLILKLIFPNLKIVSKLIPKILILH